MVREIYERAYETKFCAIATIYSTIWTGKLLCIHIHLKYNKVQLSPPGSLLKINVLNLATHRPVL